MSDQHIGTVLVLNRSTEAGDYLSSLLKGSGFTCDVKYPDSLENYKQDVSSNEIAMVVAYTGSVENVSLSGALDCNSKSSFLTPFLVITPEYSSEQLVQWMKAGACDVVAEGSDDHLTLVMARELCRGTLQSAVQNGAESENKGGNATEQNGKAKAGVVEQIAKSLNPPSADLKDTTFFIIEVLEWESLVSKYGEESQTTIQQSLIDEFKKYLSADAQCEVVDNNSFYILETSSEQSPDNIAGQITHELDQFFIDLDNQSFQVGIALAVVPLKYGLSNTDEMLERAKELLGSAIEKGVNKFDIYCPIADRERLAMEGDAHALVEYGLDNNGFKLSFQPLESLYESEEELYDVLLRVLNPEGNEVSAGLFMGAIDKTPLAEKIDKWVILQSIKRLLDKIKKSEGKKICLFIHLSPATIQDNKFLPWLYLLVKKTGINPDSLVFQFTEESVIRYKPDVETLMAGFRKIGFRTSLCQFGSTLNPMKIAQAITTNYAKFSGSITDDLAKGTADKEQQLRDMIHQLQGQGKKTIVPNVESPNTMTQIWRTGPDYVQGYFLQKPRPDMDYDFNSE